MLLYKPNPRCARRITEEFLEERAATPRKIGKIPFQGSADIKRNKSEQKQQVKRMSRRFLRGFGPTTCSRARNEWAKVPNKRKRDDRQGLERRREE